MFYFIYTGSPDPVIQGWMAAAKSQSDGFKWKLSLNVTVKPHVA